MVAEPWILRMGNQVSDNLKHALYVENLIKSNKKHGAQEKQIIGILSFEVAHMMSKIIHLYKSLTNNEILKLKKEILRSDGVKILVSSDEKLLLELALVEKLDDLNRVASVVSRLGKKCSVPALQGFEHVYGDIISGVIDVKELAFLVKDMESMSRRMERYVKSTVNLYGEMEVMNELEVATKKFQQNQHEESRKAFEQKLIWKKQDVSHLMHISLWNQTYDKVVELLARTICTVYARILAVFVDVHQKMDDSGVPISRSQVGLSGSFRCVKPESGQKSGHLEVNREVQTDAVLNKSGSTNTKCFCHSGSIRKEGSEKKTTIHKPNIESQKSGCLFGLDDFSLSCGMGPGRMFMECLSLSSSVSKADDGDDQISRIFGYGSDISGMKEEHASRLVNFGHLINDDPLNGVQRWSQFSLLNATRFRSNSRLQVYAPPSTVGGSALALHYANVIIVIEKLLRYPHLVGDEARDDLYQMLPTSLRKTLKTNLKSYVKTVAIYDAPLAHDWRERLDGLLSWLAPLSHNMIRWQSERNFEQQQTTRTNVLLFQTVYFADREKTEAAICELLVGLNYICRYEQQQNALLDCASSFDFEDCMDWKLQFDSPLHP
ncbi:protein PSK SIMULATOR 1-like [Henckelia pumila]|uniref:protein PSK SIMULATOR 1-like n=1 Tax=Henckelia pumila TaxID=405737 RepID=UPI003C6E8473